MGYALEDFVAATRAVLQSPRPLNEKLGAIAEELKRLLVDPQFAKRAYPDGNLDHKRTLYQDPDIGFLVLAHVNTAGSHGSPHTHGSSWAIYGNVSGFTDMTEWRRVNPESEDSVVLEPSKKYRVEAGQTYAYGPGVIHSTSHPGDARVIRVTGTDLDKHPRYHFNRNKDRILENA